MGGDIRLAHGRALGEVVVAGLGGRRRRSLAQLLDAGLGAVVEEVEDAGNDEDRCSQSEGPRSAIKNISMTITDLTKHATLTGASGRSGCASERG